MRTGIHAYWNCAKRGSPVYLKVKEEAVVTELKIFSLQVNLTLQMKILEQEKEIEELKKQLSLLSQGKGVKRVT